MQVPNDFKYTLNQLKHKTQEILYEEVCNPEINSTLLGKNSIKLIRTKTDVIISLLLNLHKNKFAGNCQNNLELVLLLFFLQKFVKSSKKHRKNTKQCLVVRNYDAWYTGKIDIPCIEPSITLMKQNKGLNTL